MAEPKKQEESSAAVGCLVLIGLAVYGCYWLADNAGWLYHDKLAYVIGKNWSTGEYKDCSQANTPDGEANPRIDCSSYFDSEDAKRFEVRFYGETYKEELKDKVSFVWRCKKNDGTSPAFTCDQQKIIKWDEKK